VPASFRKIPGKKRNLKKVIRDWEVNLDPFVSRLTAM
jgi:hypothetical protein